MIIITFKYRYRKQIIIGSVLLVILIGIIILFYLKKDDNKEEIIKEDIIEEKTITKKQNKKEDEYYKVDIKGEIISPGIYSLTIDSRIIDVIEKAGGLTENADTSVINLSKKISDEMVIIIYSREQVEDFKKTKEIEKQVDDKCHQITEDSLINDACINQNTKVTGKISINTANIEELMTLSGIGEAKAKEIIAYREQNGPFKELEDIMNVPGIGEKAFAQIKEDITLWLVVLFNPYICNNNLNNKAIITIKFKI